jgi:hypothetical protein
MFSIVSTRYNDTTWQENINYRKKHNYDGCIYGAPHMLSNKILIDSLVFVVEMNNSLNRIEGIGLMRNNIRLDKYMGVYTDGNFNRYVYKGNYHIDRELIIRYNSALVDIFDYILFKEKTHLKRGAGFTTIPEKLLRHKICQHMDIKKEVKGLFIYIFGNEIDMEEFETNGKNEKTEN